VNKGRFLLNNFKQASQVLNECPKQLGALMVALEISSEETFQRWHKEEKEYLNKVHEEPIEDILKMDYVELLRKRL